MDAVGDLVRQIGAFGLQVKISQSAQGVGVVGLFVENGEQILFRFFGRVLKEAEFRQLKPDGQVVGFEEAVAAQKVERLFGFSFLAVKRVKVQHGLAVPGIHLQCLGEMGLGLFGLSQFLVEDADVVQRFRTLGIVPDHLLKKVEGFFGLTHLLKRHTKVVQPGFPARPSSQGGLEALTGQAELVLALVNESQVVAEGRVVGIGLQTPLVLVLSFFKVSLVFVDGTKVVVGERVPRVSDQTGFVGHDGLIVASQLFEDVAQIVEDPCVLGVQAFCFFEGFESLGQLVHGPVHDPDVVPGFRIVWRFFEGPLELCDRQAGLALAAVEAPENHERLLIGRVDRQHLFGESFCGVILPGTVGGEGPVQKVVSALVTHGSFLCGRPVTSRLTTLTAVER